LVSAVDSVDRRDGIDLVNSRLDPFADPFATRLPPLTLEDGNQEESMLALRRMAKAFGGVPELAEEAELNANPLYGTLSPC